MYPGGNIASSSSSDSGLFLSSISFSHLTTTNHRSEQFCIDQSEIRTHLNACICSGVMFIIAAAEGVCIPMAYNQSGISIALCQPIRDQNLPSDPLECSVLVSSWVLLLPCWVSDLRCWESWLRWLRRVSCWGWRRVFRPTEIFSCWLILHWECHSLSCLPAALPSESL